METDLEIICPLYCKTMGFYLFVCVRVYVVLNRFKIESFHQLEDLSTMNPSTSRRDFKAGSHCKWILFLKKRKGKYIFFYIISLYHHKNITVSPSRRRCSVKNIHGTAKFSQLRFSMTGYGNFLSSSRLFFSVFLSRNKRAL